MAVQSRIKVLLCTQQPFVGKGFAAFLRGHPRFSFGGTCESLSQALTLIEQTNPGVVLIHLMNRINLSELHEMALVGRRSNLVLWGDEVSGEFAYQAMQLGIRGILPATATVECLFTSLSSICRGVLCFEKNLFDDMLNETRVSLTEREGQIVSLVAQGLKNKEIASALGTTEGTIKAYLYKLFKKLGINDRLHMVLYGQKNLYVGKCPTALTPGDASRTPREAAKTFIPRSLPPESRQRVFAPMPQLLH